MNKFMLISQSIKGYNKPVPWPIKEMQTKSGRSTGFKAVISQNGKRI